jgi:choline dehydrogenase-like flavoprotein
MVTNLFGPGSSAVVGALEGNRLECDIAILGSGMGGATLAWALRNSGARVLVVERGDFLRREDENWSPSAVFWEHRYRNSEPWEEGETGRTFAPGVHYYVGGNTKVFGCSFPRFREQDFEAIEHPDGVSPAWPIRYADLEPYYGQAERRYLVHGTPGGDPTEPWRSSDYPFPALPHEPSVAELAESLQRQGLHPFVTATGVDRQEGGRCIRCRTCDGFPCKVDAKGDAEMCGVLPALKTGSVRLLTRAYVERLETSEKGTEVTEAVLVRDGIRLRLRAARFAVACGAVNSAALLLRSTSAKHSRGLANSSGLVGRNYMVHNSTFFMGIDPRRRNTVNFQKTLGMNDWYLPGAHGKYPLGNLQMLGKLQGPMVKAARPWLPMPLADYLTAHSVDVYLTTEDVPDSHNRVELAPSGRIRVHWRPNNLATHREFVRRTVRAFRRSGFPLILTERMGIAVNSHMCGTLVMGHDRSSSVLNSSCRAHDVDNLWVGDSASFPSSAALNPALTIAANALRVAAEGGIAK